MMLISHVLNLKPVLHPEKDFQTNFCGRLAYTKVGLQLHGPPFRSKLNLNE